jgi:hypothetical protein
MPRHIAAAVAWAGYFADYYGGTFPSKLAVTDEGGVENRLLGNITFLLAFESSDH